MNINRSFWDLTFPERKLWLDSHIYIAPVRNRANAEVEQYKRSHSLSYLLPLATSKEPVCKVMFLATLGLKTDGIITEFIKRKKAGTVEAMIKDNRGKKPPKTKTEKELIRQHIMSYRPQVSHYKLKNAPNKRYLEPHLTITSMWEDYKSKHGDISYIVYQRVVKSENIGFGKPAQNDCDVCAKYQAQCKAHDELHIVDDCADCEAGKEHDRKYRAARAYYSQDRDGDMQNTAIYTADMQKVILLPKLTVKEHFFVSRLVVFNETFASVKQDGDYVLLWHEAISGRLGVDVASTYIRCINLCEVEKVIFWADNCVGQNKNWILFIALCWCVNQVWGPQVVTMKYFERGHTFMRADSVHGSIGKKMKKCPEVCTFPDFVDVCEKAGSKIKPIIMHYHDFHEFEDGHRNRKSKNVTLPHLDSLSVVEFRKDSRAMWFKKSFEEEYNQVEFLKPKFSLDIVPPKKDKPRGISSIKRQNILKLANSFPAAKKKFWLEIPINDENVDLVEHFQ